jgi:DNA topoisomerase II
VAWIQREIKPVSKHKYEVLGVVKKLNDTTVEITELLIHTKWTQNYKEEFEAMITGDKEKEKEANPNTLYSVTDTDMII